MNVSGLVFTTLLQVVRMVELLGLLECVDCIREEGKLVGLFNLLNIKQQVIPDTIDSPSFDALKRSCQWLLVVVIPLILLDNTNVHNSMFVTRL